MRRFDNVPTATNKMATSLKYLVVVMASMIAMPVSQADVAGKKIGDLEIYKAAETGKTTITMMLDTSGSMTINQVKDACDLPGGADYKVKGSEPSTTTPIYTRDYCLTTLYFYRNNGNKWYRCGADDGSGSSSYNTTICKKEISKPADTADYNTLKSSSNYYYYKEDKAYDRLTRLKDAIFTLMDSTQLDPKKVAIGIGQYSSQSEADNRVYFNTNGTAKNADSRTGKILLPAALLDEVQRQKIRDAVAAAGGGQGTPTANAYAEVGAYMLGTKTSGTGSGFAKSATASKSGSSYISPLLKPSSCDGRGIYFLTDGAPNNSTSPLNLMRFALNRSSFSVSNNGLPLGSGTENGMPEVGAFSRALRDSTISPLGTDQEIYTAVVGFGADFDVDREEDEAKPEAQRVIRTLPYTNPKTGVTTNRDFYNCEKIVGKNANATKDARNACNWGEKAHPSLPGVGGFGEGGFYSAQSTEDIVNSIISFVTDLDQTLPSTPSGTIIIPDDPYRADSQLAVAYYPTLQPKVGNNSVIWEGNLKKYRLNEGTLFGKGNAKLFKNIAGELDPGTQDFWSDTNYLGANDKVESGGFYAQLKTPASDITSVRTLYVEDWKSKTDHTTVLRKVGVNGSGKITVDNVALTDTTFQDTVTYNQATLKKLLNFLGFDILPSTAVKDMTLTPANVSKAIKVLGATIHSTPAAVSYSATLDADGRVTDTRDDYVLFGSTEGGLHLVDAADYGSGDGGKEKFVMIPREMLKDASKSEALIKGAIKSDIGSPSFGVDAPWLVTADYKYDFDAKRVNIDTTDKKGVFAYGGLRLGGEAFYGLNLTDNNNPKMIFSITPDTAGFGRMGQIWEKPTKARIRTSNAANDKGLDVLVFGGGYDMCYENESFQVGITDPLLGSCSNKSDTKGNAVYIINAKTGELIWSASNTVNSVAKSSTTVASMKHSIVAGITTLDRDNDGYMDHIYFADLSGQIFRADFTNAGFLKPVTSGTPKPETSFKNTRVTRVLQSAYSGNDTRFNYRFYERPNVSFYRNPTSNTLFALVNAISGDRSSPLSKIRDESKTDRLYGIMDSDVTKPDHVFYADDFTTTGGQKIKDLVADKSSTSNLMELPSAIGALSSGGYSKDQKNAVINTLKAGTKQGWYYPLSRFDGYANVRYSKGIGKSEIVDSFLYTTVYNPDMSYGNVDSCSAEVTGGSERQLYCLPYGICTDDLSKDGTGGFVRAGKGIQELTLGPRSSALSNQRLLIGTQTLAERANDRVNFGGDSGKGLFNALTNSIGLNQGGLKESDSTIGSGTAPELVFNDRFTLQPKTWYEVD